MDNDNKEGNIEQLELSDIIKGERILYEDAEGYKDLCGIHPKDMDREERQKIDDLNGWEINDEKQLLGKKFLREEEKFVHLLVNVPEKLMVEYLQNFQERMLNVIKKSDLDELEHLEYQISLHREATNKNKEKNYSNTSRSSTPDLEEEAEILCHSYTKVNF